MIFLNKNNFHFLLAVGNSYSCTFEDQNCFLDNAADDDFDWTIRQVGNNV